MPKKPKIKPGPIDGYMTPEEMFVFSFREMSVREVGKRWGMHPSTSHKMSQSQGWIRKRNRFIKGAADAARGHHTEEWARMVEDINQKHLETGRKMVGMAEKGLDILQAGIITIGKRLGDQKKKNGTLEPEDVEAATSAAGLDLKKLGDQLVKLMREGQESQRRAAGMMEASIRDRIIRKMGQEMIRIISKLVPDPALIEQVTWELKRVEDAAIADNDRTIATSVSELMRQGDEAVH
jgi:hypothetical protein